VRFRVSATAIATPAEAGRLAAFAVAGDLDEQWLAGDNRQLGENALTLAAL
jgi:hypothetical protein